MPNVNSDVVHIPDVLQSIHWYNVNRSAVSLWELNNVEALATS